MSVLHIFRNKPDERTRVLVATLSEGRSRTFDLFDETVDYDELVKLVFDADRVICWW